MAGAKGVRADAALPRQRIFVLEAAAVNDAALLPADLPIGDEAARWGVRKGPDLGLCLR